MILTHIAILSAQLINLEGKNGNNLLLPYHIPLLHKFGLALNMNKNLVHHKTFGKAQNILGPVGRRGINLQIIWRKTFVTGTICKSNFGLAQKLGPDQNILKPVEVRGISVCAVPKIFRAAL